MRIVIIFTMLLLSSSTALSCSCAFSPVLTKFNQSAAVFIGIVERFDDGGKGQKVASLRIKKGFKLVDDSNTISIQTPSISPACGYNFTIGESYLVFASRAEDGSLKTSLCSGTVESKHAKKDLMELDKLLSGEL